MAQGLLESLPKYFAVVMVGVLDPSASFEHQTASSKGSIPIVDVQMGTPVYFDAGGDSWDAGAGDWRNPVFYRYTLVPVKFVTAPAEPVVQQ